MTAVVLLVFRDTILSLVASIQLTGNDMVQVGDWIEMPSVGADGDVIDIALHTVKVQNWDKTISTIPTYRLITESFKNWRGMSRSGGRRIKRSVYIDQSTIRSLSDEEVERFKRFALLKQYVEEKQAEIAAYNRGLGPEAAAEVNWRRMTNVGTLRAYVVNYLRHHPKIHQGMTLIVRQLDPTPQGLPIEIYAFTNTTAWAEYEGIMSDIFDHILAILPEFGLRVFQQPSGADLEKLASGARSLTQ
jgi:miniconductance mechanosensitive channel